MDIYRLKGREEDKAEGIAKTGVLDETKIVSLVKRAAGGDFEAFGELYSVYLDRIYRYVFYQVKDKMTAEDLTEEIFVKAWGAIGSYKGQGQSYSSWLYRIAHNHVIDYFRIRRQHMSLIVDIPASVVGPEEEAERHLMQEEVLELISCLPPQQKQVVILRFIEDLDNHEIEEITGKSQGAIRVMQMRALAMLRQRLNNEKEREWVSSFQRL
ncbi:sigma-70 family RNA polymerase sigma factor [Chloroflexota bacterium]